MIKRITNNFGIKVFCVLLALVLWAYVAAGQSTVGKFPGKIKIKATNIPSGLEAVYDIKTVDIKIMADSATWKKLSADSFTAFVDLGAHTEGTYEVPVVVTSNVSGVSIVEKDPEKIFVRLESIISKEIPAVNSRVISDLENLTLTLTTFRKPAWSTIPFFKSRIKSRSVSVLKLVKSNGAVFT